ncbi:MAG: hypothetical protein AB7I50_17410 [Vicinamibacterales bacterium]
MAELDAEIESATQELAKADGEERKKLYEDIQKKKAEKKELEEKRAEKVKVKGKIDWGLILSGLANIAIGVALTVFTAGWGVVVGEALISGGLAMVGAGLLPLIQSKDEMREFSEKKIDRPDVDESRQPSAEESQQVTDAFQQQGLTNITAASGGNFAVFVAPEGYWQVVQISPPLVVAVIGPTDVEASSNDKGVAQLSDLGSPQVSAIRSPKTRIVLEFTATTAAQVAIVGNLTESAGIQSTFLLTVE